MQLFSKKDKKETRTVVIDSLNYKSESSFWPMFFQSILLCTTLVGFLYCVSTSVDMSINFGIICSIAIPIMIASILFSLNKAVFISFVSVIGISILSLMIFVKTVFTKIVDSFVFCYNLTIDIMVEQGYTNYKSSMTEDISEYLLDEQYMSECFYTVIIVLAIIFSVLFSATLLKRSLVWVSALPCFIVLTPSLYFGATPNGIAFSIFISGILGCYIESISKLAKRSKSKDSNKDKKKIKTLSTAVNGFTCMCVSLVLSLSISVALFSSEGFQIDSIRKVIDDFAQKIMNMLFYDRYETSEGAIGGLLDGDVLELKTPDFRDLPVMTVTTKTNTPLYLRGWIGDDLVENGWKVLDENDSVEYNQIVNDTFDETTQYFNYMKFVSDNLSRSDTAEEISKMSKEETERLGFVYDKVDVKAKYTKSLMVFTPVRCLSDEITAKGSSIELIGDTITFFKNKRSKNNQYSYDAVLQSFANRDFYLSIDKKLGIYNTLTGMLPKDSASVPEQDKEFYDFVTAEQKYRDYVNGKYLSVPENSDMLKNLATQLTSSYSQNFAKALAIEKYFKSEYKYAKNFTYSAGGALQKVNYMINETKTGYCTYFATAMTVMMRHLGIPARYVIGYHAMSSADADGNSVVRQIDDKNYHAWVEVYFDGMGWLTFDPTPGINTNTQLRDYDYLDDPVPPQEDEIEDTPEQNEEQPPVIQQASPPSVNVNDIPMEVYVDIPLFVIILIPILLLILLTFITLFIMSRVIKSKFKTFVNGLHNVYPTSLVKILYPRIMILLKSRGFSPESGEMMKDFVKRVDNEFKLEVSIESVLPTLEMSQFSQNEIDISSAAAVFDAFTLLYTSVFYSLNVFKKYFYMYKIIKKK